MTDHEILGSVGLRQFTSRVFLKSQAYFLNNVFFSIFFLFFCLLTFISDIFFLFRFLSSVFWDILSCFIRYFVKRLLYSKHSLYLFLNRYRLNISELYLKLFLSKHILKSIMTRVNNKITASG